MWRCVCAFQPRTCFVPRILPELLVIPFSHISVALTLPQKHARDIDERRNRLTQEQLSARNQALHRTMQARVGAPGLAGGQRRDNQDCLPSQRSAPALVAREHRTYPALFRSPPPLQVLLHASKCADNKCPSTSCARVKAMFHHAMSCPVKLAGNCQYCR